MSNQTHTIQSREAGQRLDIFCTHACPDFSRSVLQKAIKEGQITINDQATKPRYLIKTDDVVIIDMPPASQVRPPAQFQATSLPTIYEDKDIVVIDKPAGILVHPTQVSTEPTVASWLTEHFPDTHEVGDNPSRAGIVHRLDRDTSGALILAKTQEAFEHLKSQFKKHRVKKEYLALVFGMPNSDEGRINQPITRSRRNPARRTIDPAGQPAITEWRIEEKFNDSYTLMRTFPLTGRTHQIRVHLHFIGHPIVGDPLYVFKRKHSPKGVARQLLHAAKITLALPSGKRKTFTAPLPEDFQNVLNQLGDNSDTSEKPKDNLGFRTPSSFKANKRK